MPLLDHCWFCSLQVAASVIAVYVSVAYVIAFLVEVWWIWEIRGQVPYLAYILTTGYLVTFILSAILVRGVSNRRISYLVLWMCGILAILLPEAGLALFMGFQFWKVHTLYGLTEVTCWACRLTVNVAGLVCVQSLYSLWREEKEVITSLRDLNMASVNTMNGRRTSVSSDRSRIQNSYSNPTFKENIEFPSPKLKRTGSSLSIGHHPIPPPPSTPPPPVGNNCEFNASLFDTTFRSSMRITKSRSLMELNTDEKPKQPEPRYIPKFTPQPVMSREPSHRRLFRSHSVSYFPTGEGRLRNGYFTSQYPSPGYILDPLGRVAYIQDPQFILMNSIYYPPNIVPGSKTSLAESDDTQKYRDVAL